MKYISFFFLTLFIFLPQQIFAQSRIEAQVIHVEDQFIRLETNDGTRISIPEDDTFSYALPDIQPGDTVIVEQQGEGEEAQYHIVDFVRMPALIFLTILFLLVIALINRKHGIKSIVNLIVTFGVILYIIIPLILKGWPPVLVTTIGGLLAIGWSIYFSYGLNKKAHASIIALLASLITVGVLSTIFIGAASLTGFVSDESSILLALGYSYLDVRGLLLAAIMIGALGVLDDLVISQVSLVEQLKKNNPDQSRLALWKSALTVGHDHTSAIINTLFLAYASASLPLVILLSLHEPPFDSLSSIINNEYIATEIVRALVGSIGILLSMPISTYIAVLFYTKKD